MMRRLIQILFVLLLIPIIGFYGATAVSTYSPKTSFHMSIPVSMYVMKWERVKAQTEIQFETPYRRWELLKKHGTSIEKIQWLVNQFPYRNDIDVYGTEEYWATPYEFLLNFGGDCEDYAIVKYYLLKNIGFTDDQMRIVSLRTESGEGHAVLIVEHEGKLLLLDNRYAKIIPVDQIPEKYIPYYGMNISGYWRYFPKLI